MIADITGRPIEAEFTKLLAEPTSDVLKQSKTFADEVRMLYPPGPFGEGLLAARAEHPTLKFLIPFYSIGAGTWRWMGQHTPILGRAWTSVGEDFAAGGDRKAMAFARMELGGLLLAGGALLAWQGITRGKGTENPETKRAFGDSLPPSYTVRVGPADGPNTHVPLWWLGPPGLMLALAADYHEVTQDLPDHLRMEAAAAVLLAFNRSWSQQTFLAPTAETIEAVLDAESNPAKLNALVKQYARGAPPLSAALRGIERLADPSQREAFTALDALRAGVPGLSADLAAQRNVFGEVTMGPDALWTSVPNDPVVKEMRRLKLNVPMPPKVITVEGAGRQESVFRTATKDQLSVGVPLLEHEYALVVELSGQGKAALGDGREVSISQPSLREELATMIASEAYRETYTDGPRGTRADAILGLISARQRAAQALLIQEYDPIFRAWEAKIRAMGQLKTTGAAPSIGPGLQLQGR
jgi:hypothetical protein